MAPGQASGPSAAEAEMRDERVGEQMRELNGHVEELRHGLDPMKQAIRN